MFGALVFLAMAIDLTGQWRAIVSAQSQKAEINLSLRQNGDSLTGSMQMQDILMQIDKGTVDGDTLTFSAAFPIGGKLIEAPFQGRIEGEHIRLQIEGMDVVAARVPPKPDAERIERLSGLFRLWGIIKFFHPYVVRGAVDWDAALLRAIPKVESGKTAEEYRSAVQSMPRSLLCHAPTSDLMDASVGSRAISGDFFHYLQYKEHHSREHYLPQIRNRYGAVTGVASLLRAASPGA